VEQVKLWITKEDGSVTPLSIRDHIEYEQRLEDMLVARPDMLGDGVALVGRQLRTAGGPLDLLGIDESGNLVVYELKRGKTPREALTQAIDYASWLDTLGYDELANRLSEHEPEGLVRDFDDFDRWYSDRFVDDPSDHLRPTRIVIIGLGADADTERMAQWLNGEGVDIEVVAFHAFDHNGQTVLARQLEVVSEDASRGRGSPGDRADPFEQAREFGAEEVLRTAFDLVRTWFDDDVAAIHTFKWGFNFALPPTDDRPNQRYPAYLGVFVRGRGSGQIDLRIRPAAVEACPDELTELLQSVEAVAIRAARTPSETEAFITVDAEKLEHIAPHLRKFAEAAITVWQRDWDEWNADVSAHDPATTVSEGTES
jgi:hypothetical protein